MAFPGGGGVGVERGDTGECSRHSGIGKGAVSSLSLGLHVHPNLIDQRPGMYWIATAAAGASTTADGACGRGVIEFIVWTASRGLLSGKATSDKKLRLPPSQTGSSERTFKERLQSTQPIAAMPSLLRQAFLSLLWSCCSSTGPV